MAVDSCPDQCPFWCPVHEKHHPVTNMVEWCIERYGG